jgi:hypothetical protein
VGAILTEVVGEKVGYEAQMGSSDSMDSTSSMHMRTFSSIRSNEWVGRKIYTLEIGAANWCG